MSGQHTPTPWFHRQAGVIRHGEAYDWVADHPEQGRHRKIIVQRHACLPEDYAFIVEAVNSYDRNRATIDALVGALEKIACFDDETASEWLEKTGSYASFDEPGSVAVARAALQLARGEKGDVSLPASKEGV